MNITIIHPSRGRSKQAFETANKWLSRAKGLVEYIMSIDNNDPQLYSYVTGACDTLSNRSIRLCQNDNTTAIQAINKAAETARGDLFIVVSDDFSCEDGWDELLLEALTGKEDFIVKTQDGLQPTLITLPIMDRVYYERFGYIYHPEYLHMWSDTEMTVVGHYLGKVITLSLLFEHLHYSAGKSCKDEINIKNDATWRQGEHLFNRRLKFNFDIENPVMDYKDIVWK